MKRRANWNWVCFLAGLAVLNLTTGSTVLAQELGPAVCGSLQNTFGPFDYRTNKDKLPIVERFHFTPDVENLRKGASTDRIGGDISYTLRAFPNHTRALLAMSRLAQREKTNRPRGSTYTVDCWFERAIRFRPEDADVRMTHGIYLAQTGRKGEAAKMLESAASLGASGANFHYNMGLIYADIGRYDEALAHAHKAYSMGFPLPGLKNKLQRAGKWRDAPAS